jgi:hypothetical protein
MLKIKKIQLSGFRGMLKTHELDFTRKGEASPAPLVLYGLNSSGKTSFVDGIEWFLSPANEIEWLAREDAKERAYPHQEAKNDESFVEIEFQDTEKKIGLLKKTFNHKKITQPSLSSKEYFEKVYESFVIKPFLRYLEVIDFVYNRSGAEKYQKLASWMGFEGELAFQEKIALDIMPALKRKEKSLSDNVVFLEKHLSGLLTGGGADELNLIGFCNQLIKTHNISPAKNLQDLWQAIQDLSRSKTISATSAAVGKLAEIEVSLSTTNFATVVVDSVQDLQEALAKLSKEQKLLEKIDVISLYSQALDILNKITDIKTNCPICGTEWERGKLLQHIQDEMEMLRGAKEKKEEIKRSIGNIKVLIRREQEIVKQVVRRYEEAKQIIPTITFSEIAKYQSELTTLESSLAENLFINAIQFTTKAVDITRVNTEKEELIKQMAAERAKVQPSKDELKLIEDIEKLNQIRGKWSEIETAQKEAKFFSKELESFAILGNALVKLVQDNIKSRFGEMSMRIGKYFNILRSDKDIKQIEIVLNEAKGRAAGRSAEIQLNYFDIAVKPAYKVLSESLLNSLGLAVYFACVKQFNTDCKFVVLDDIMNSLDIENRDTVLDLIEQEFADYQIVLFTHDYYWFQRIVRRFPQWICKKIKGWDYKGGARIDFAKTTKEEINELLSDATTIEDSGFKLGKHIEGILNELCENIEAEVKHRYTRSDPPSMEELFDALHKRLKNKLGKNEIVEKVLNAKKYEPITRNFTVHPRGNYPATISATEVKRAADEWFVLEKDLWCSDCRHYVEYIQKKDGIECRCGKLKLIKVP